LIVGYFQYYYLLKMLNYCYLRRRRKMGRKV